jgi:hypothetical protein
MWQVLGKDSIYIDIAKTWKDRMIELMSDRENEARFKELMNATEVLYYLDGTMEIHSFILEFPDTITPEDIQFLADKTLEIAKENLEIPFITVNGVYQKCQVIYTTEKEPELIGANKTKGYNSGKIFQPIFEALSQPGRGNESLM